MSATPNEEMYGPPSVQALAGDAARASGSFDTERDTGDPDDGFLDGFGEASFRAGFWQGWQAASESATEPICCSCWNKRHPDNRANTGGPVHGPVEVCQDCGGPTSAMLRDAARLAGSEAP